jgi:lipopolysaccharide/colanic/teichoic acid biosynthesis glycosyltransferase
MALVLRVRLPLKFRIDFRGTRLADVPAKSGAKSGGAYNMYFRRPLELVLAALLLVLFLPLLVVIGIFVRLKLGAPVLFSQLRPGLHGKIFKLYKFRTMLDPANKDIKDQSDASRLMPFGQSLRKTSLDELPGLWNVLKGEMSFVGPRPLLVEYLPLYNDRQRRRHEVRPGITGWAQVNGRNSLNWEEKFELDVWYVENSSLLLDLKIILMTVWKVLAREGVNRDGHVTMPAFRGNSSKS